MCTVGRWLFSYSPRDDIPIILRHFPFFLFLLAPTFSEALIFMKETIPQKPSHKWVIEAESTYEQCYNIYELFRVQTSDWDGCM